MKKEKTIRTYQRRTKSGKVVTVRQHTASYDAAEKLREMAKKKGAGKEFEDRKSKGMPDPSLPLEQYLDELSKRKKGSEAEDSADVSKEAKKGAEKKTKVDKQTKAWFNSSPSSFSKVKVSKDNKYGGWRIDLSDGSGQVYGSKEEAQKDAKLLRGMYKEWKGSSKGPNGSTPTKTSALASSPAFTAAEFKEWYHGTGSAADKKVAKALRAQLGRAGYRKFEDEAIDNYSSRGHLSMFKRVSGGSGVNESKKGAASAKRMTLDEYLGSKGLSSPVSDFMIDKTKLPHGLTQRGKEKLHKEADKAANEYQEKRAAAIKEYKKLVKEGKIVAPTSSEQLNKIAEGHPDNASTQAAKRVLEKRAAKIAEKLPKGSFITVDENGNEIPIKKKNTMKQSAGAEKEKKSVKAPKNESQGQREARWNRGEFTADEKATAIMVYDLSGSKNNLHPKLSAWAKKEIKRMDDERAAKVDTKILKGLNRDVVSKLATLQGKKKLSKEDEAFVDKHVAPSGLIRGTKVSAFDAISAHKKESSANKSSSPKKKAKDSDLVEHYDQFNKKSMGKAVGDSFTFSEGRGKDKFTYDARFVTDGKGRYGYVVRDKAEGPGAKYYVGISDGYERHSQLPAGLRKAAEAQGLKFKGGEFVKSAGKSSAKTLSAKEEYKTYKKLMDEKQKAGKRLSITETTKLKKLAKAAGVGRFIE